MSVLSGVNKTRTTQAGQIRLKTAQQGVSQTRSHDLRGNALPSSMSDPQFSNDSGAKVYCADPTSPRQRGADENANGLLRQYFPTGTELSG